MTRYSHVHANPWIPGLVEAEVVKMENTLPGVEGSILTTSSSFVNCLGSCWRQLMQPSFDISINHGSRLIIVWYIVSACLYSTCQNSIKIFHGQVRSVMFSGGHQDLLMLCWRSRHSPAQSLFSLFLSTVLTYGNPYVLVK